MVVVKIELWPHGDEEQKRPLGVLTIANDGSGDARVGHYDVTASHAGAYFGRRREPYRTGKVRGFPRQLSPYRLVCRALKAIGEL
ncbi:MAG TPA: hypothetical protein VG826_29100 [Pirellulales bacterium]|nr:hypothetical protein [Pirellulales bacterium]